MQEPLVSIGVPTFNRPESLFLTLKSIVGQTHCNLEIIISDNCSTNPRVREIIDEYSKKDKRIISFNQSRNIGGIENFNFVLSKASANYFIWAADDDEWQGADFLASLVKYAPENILTFPDAVTTDNPEVRLLKSYENCRNKIEYIKNFCAAGWGYPFYGLYNLKLFNKYKLKFEFDNELAYYSEGTFLHKLFLAGPSKYVKEAKILYTPNGSRPSNDVLIDNYVKYFKSTLLIYANSNLDQKEKSEILSIVLDTNTAYFRGLLNDFVSFDGFKVNKIKKAALKKQSAARNAWLKLKHATSVLVNRN